MTTDLSTDKSTPLSVVIAWRAVLLSYGAILALFTVDGVMTWMRGAPVAVAFVLWALRVIPLAIFLPGLRRRSPRVAAWLSFAILLYFIHAVTTAFVPGEALYGTVYALLCAAVFTSVVVWIRLMRKHYQITLQNPQGPH
ncbi:MAG: DUF2069 domain-containing protein [Pseudohongiellaceae bacterium]